MSRCIDCKNKNEYSDICIKQRYQFFFADGSVVCEDFETLESEKKPEPGEFTEKVADFRSPLAKARDEYFLSKEGQKLCEGGSSGQYLKNRLERAFIEGWTQAENQLMKGGDK